MNIRIQGFTGVYMCEQENRVVYIAIQGCTGKYRGLQEDT